MYRIKQIIDSKVYKIKSIVQINTSLINSNVEEQTFSNDISFSTPIFLPPIIDSDQAVNFIKNILFNNNIKEYSTLKRIIKSIKKMKMKKKQIDYSIYYI